MSVDLEQVHSERPQQLLPTSASVSRPPERPGVLLSHRQRLHLQRLRGQSRSPWTQHHPRQEGVADQKSVCFTHEHKTRPFPTLDLRVRWRLRMNTQPGKNVRREEVHIYLLFLGLFLLQQPIKNTDLDFCSVLEPLSFCPNIIDT